MKTSTRRGLSLAIALLAVLVVPATPAYADLTQALDDFSAVSTNAQLTETLTVRCPRSDIFAFIAADGRSATGFVRFTGGAGTTCVENAFGTSVDIECLGTVRFVVQASVPGVSASGDLQLDNNFVCWIDTLLSDRTIRGPQTIRACWTLQQASQRLTLNCAGIRSSTGNTSLSASYAVLFRLSVS